MGCCRTSGNCLEEVSKGTEAGKCSHACAAFKLHTPQSSTAPHGISCPWPQDAAGNEVELESWRGFTGREAGECSDDDEAAFRLHAVLISVASGDCSHAAGAFKLHTLHSSTAPHGIICPWPQDAAGNKLELESWSGEGSWWMQSCCYLLLHFQFSLCEGPMHPI